MTTIVLAAFIHGDRVLVVRRAAHKRQYPEHWDLVGGHVEIGETTDAALIREAQEEVGVTPINFRHLKSFADAATPDCENIRYQLYAVTEWSGGAPRLLGEEHTDLAWIAIGNVNSLTAFGVFRTWSKSPVGLSGLRPTQSDFPQFRSFYAPVMSSSLTNGPRDGSHSTDPMPSVPC